MKQNTFSILFLIRKTRVSKTDQSENPVGVFI